MIVSIVLVLQIIVSLYEVLQMMVSESADVLQIIVSLVLQIIVSLASVAQTSPEGLVFSSDSREAN